MDIAGICDICAKTGAVFSCGLCGKRVCKDCVTVQGICKKCACGKRIDADKSIVQKVMNDKGLHL